MPWRLYPCQLDIEKFLLQERYFICHRNVWRSDVKHFLGHRLTRVQIRIGRWQTEVGVDHLSERKVEVYLGLPFHVDIVITWLIVLLGWTISGFSLISSRLLRPDHTLTSSRPPIRHGAGTYTRSLCCERRAKIFRIKFLWVASLGNNVRKIRASYSTNSMFSSNTCDHFRPWKILPIGHTWVSPVVLIRFMPASKRPPRKGIIGFPRDATTNIVPAAMPSDPGSEINLQQKVRSTYGAHQTYIH
jgi:hypothetical protein